MQPWSIKLQGCFILGVFINWELQYNNFQHGCLPTFLCTTYYDFIIRFITFI
jgi:hypothetical protein